MIIKKKVYIYIYIMLYYYLFIYLLTSWYCSSKKFNNPQ